MTDDYDADGARLDSFRALHLRLHAGVYLPNADGDFEGNPFAFAAGLTVTGAAGAAEGRSSAERPASALGVAKLTAAVGDWITSDVALVKSALTSAPALTVNCCD
jgi:hypothetical protein